MMAMWTIGYSAADALAIAQTTTDQQGSTWVSRLMWVVMLSCLLAYAGWQSYLCYQSYHTPAWAYNVDRPASIRYPAVLVCPLGYKSPHSLLTENTTCTYGVDNGDGDYNETNCGVKIVYLGQSKKGPLIVCVVANSEPDNQAVTWAYGNVHTYLEIGLAVNKNKSKAKNGALYPVQFSLFTQNTVKDYRALTHNFVAMPGNAFWGLVSKNQDVYLDGTTQDEYDVSVSSTRINDNTQLTATFSFTSFDVSQSTEYVYFDWLSLLGVLGGASSLAMAGHLLGMLMYEKGILHTYNWWKGRKYEELGDDQRALTELSVNRESERLMTMAKN